MKFLRFFLGIILCIVIILLLAYLLVPFCFSPVPFWSLNSIVDADSARLYYSIAGPVTTALMAIAGVILGYFYFQSRKDFDKKFKQLDQGRACIRMILAYLEKYNVIILMILNKEFTNQNHLEMLRLNFQELWEIILALLQYEFAKEIFATEDVGKILEIDSFINKQKILLEDSAETIRAQKMDDVISEYKKLYRAASKACTIKGL